MAPVPAAVTGRMIVMDCLASNVSRLVLVQLNPTFTAMFVAPPPVATFTSPAANMFVRSPTFRVAFGAVAVQVPLVQVTFRVALVDISTDAFAKNGTPMALTAAARAIPRINGNFDLPR